MGVEGKLVRRKKTDRRTLIKDGADPMVSITNWQT